MLQTTTPNTKLEAYAANDKALTQNSQFAQTLDATNARNLSDQEFVVNANIADTLGFDEVPEAVELEMVDPDLSTKSPLELSDGNALPLSGQPLPSLSKENGFQPSIFQPLQTSPPENQKSMLSDRSIDVEVFSEEQTEPPLDLEVAPDSAQVASRVVRAGEDRVNPFERGAPEQTQQRHLLSQARYPDSRTEVRETSMSVGQSKTLSVGRMVEDPLSSERLSVLAKQPSDVGDALAQTKSPVAAVPASEAEPPKPVPPKPAPPQPTPPEAMARLRNLGLPQGEKPTANVTLPNPISPSAQEQVLRGNTSGDAQTMQSSTVTTTVERSSAILATNPSQPQQTIVMQPRIESPNLSVGVEATNGGSPPSNVEASSQTIAAALGLRTKSGRGAYEGARAVQQTMTPSADQAALMDAPADAKLVSEGAERPHHVLARVEGGITDVQRASGMINAQTIQAPTREMGEAVNEQIMRAMGRQALAHGRFTLQLNPRELGALDVEFSTERGELKIAVISRESHTRELLDTNINRLRQSLQDAGITVGDLDVRQEGKGEENSSDASARHRQSPTRDLSGTSIEPSVAQQTLKPNDTLFDIYV